MFVPSGYPLFKEIHDLLTKIRETEYKTEGDAGEDGEDLDVVY